MIRKKVAVEIGRQTLQAPPGEDCSRENYASCVFDISRMEERLPPEVYQEVLRASKGHTKVAVGHADAIAEALKKWALEEGATHYTHWFLPMTGAAAQKDDFFWEWEKGVPLETFTGQQLLQGEPDASSLPSGGLRSTYEARGYSIWDPSSPPFIWESNGGKTLCIPSLFFSWNGDALDHKTPLLRSEVSLVSQIRRLLSLMGGPESEEIYTTLGLELEFFLIDKSFRNLRPDLLLVERTIFGAASPKGQELEDHYFSAIKPRVLSFMREVERWALVLGIPIKTRHNEVAPAQHEIALCFDRAPLSIDRNVLLMELMRQVALKQNLCCLFHEKPFATVNGSGKHSNWSLYAQGYGNLLDPSGGPEKKKLFLFLLTAVLDGLFLHREILQASITTAGNDHRLGGQEAPPPILSVYLGEALENLLQGIRKEKRYQEISPLSSKLSSPHFPELPKDNTDRNRTSFVAFTGNKFEFRAVGSSSNCAFPITAINSLVGSSLEKLLDETEKRLEGKRPKNSDELMRVALPLIREHLEESSPILFSGDCYSDSWAKEAKRRGLFFEGRAFHSYEPLKGEKSKQVFRKILSPQELESRYEVLCDDYAKTTKIEASLARELFQTQILPACVQWQTTLARAIDLLKRSGIKKIPLGQRRILEKYCEILSQAQTAADHLQQSRLKIIETFPAEKRARTSAEELIPCMEHLRRAVDQLEESTDDSLWPLPKYRELLFLV